MRSPHFVILASVLSFLIVSCAVTRKPMLTLVQEGTSEYVIVLDPEAIPAEQHAAKELRRYVERSTGARLPIVERAQGRRAIFVGPGGDLGRFAPDLKVADFGSEEFVLETRNGNLIILGGGSRGTMYGVYTFLEDVLGCRWYTRDVEKVPRHKNLSIPALHRREAPAFEYREPFFTEAFDKLWAARNRVNSINAHLDESVGDKIHMTGFVHTFYPLVPPDKCFKDHPEYFSLIDGKRTWERAQLCLSNPDVLRIVVERIFERIEANPKSTIFSVSQNDWAGYCQCEQCRAIDEAEGSPSGSLITFCNKVAEAVAARYPDKYIDTLAYQYTEDPPRHVRPHPNLIVRLCHMAPSCDSHPLATCPKNADYVEHLRSWTAITDKVYVWHYVTNFAHYLMPFPNFNAIRQDIPFYNREGVKGIFCQGSYSSGGGGEMAELRSYVLAKLLWDPETDVDATIDDFLQGVYGRAWKPIRQYFDLLHNRVQRHNIHIDLYSPPESGHLTSAIRRKSQALFREALRLADDSVVRTRVEKARLWIDYADLYFQCRGIELTAKGEINPELIKRFIRTAKANGLTHVSEGSRIEPFYESLRVNGPFVTSWWILGPFPGGEGPLSERKFGPEERVSFDDTFEGLGGQELRWRKVVSSEAYLDFTKHVHPHDMAVAYAFTYLLSDREQEIVLSVGSNDGVAIRLNGKLVHDNPARRRASPDQDRVPVRLRAGRNDLLVKVDQVGADWGLYVRLLPGGAAVAPTLKGR